MNTCFKKLFPRAFLMLILVVGSEAQVSVNVTLDPSRPVPIGVTKFRCDFLIAPGDSLREQHWQITSGERIFQYSIGNKPVKHPDYDENILGWETDNATYLEIELNVTACEEQQYQCHILTQNTNEGQAQISLEATNCTNNVTCGGDVDGNTGLIESPNFPSTYPDDTFCEWTITVPEFNVIRFEIIAFDLENCCSCDYVEIRDGPGPSSSLIVRLCDPLNDTSTAIMTTNNTAYVLFRSDISQTDSGFQIYWEAVSSVTTEEAGTTTTTSPQPAGETYAFSVSLSEDRGVDDSPLVFDNVLYNQQGVYNTVSGIFEPPVHGLYFVTTSCLSTAGTNFHVYIARNENQILCKSIAADVETFVGTCSAVVELFPGDQVRVTGNIEHIGVAVGDGFSGFSGYMITKLT